jgi:hypothetical protein
MKDKKVAEAQSISEMWVIAFYAAYRRMSQAKARQYATYYCRLLRRYGCLRPWWPYHAEWLLNWWCRGCPQ